MTATIAKTCLNSELVLPPLPSVTRGRSCSAAYDVHRKRLVYAHGNLVFLRNIYGIGTAEVYCGHSKEVTAVAISPCGNYVASGCVAGNVRIWDATNIEHVLKAEYQVLAGTIHSLAWDSETRNIAAVGSGRDKFAHVFAFDSGSSCGELGGHSKHVNAVAIRPCRPYRAATASDDFTVNFYHGTPYKFAKSIKDHTRFVQTAKFSPDGSMFVTGGADGRILLYDGLSGEKIKELAQRTGAVMAADWSLDSSLLAVASTDCTCTVWEVKSGILQRTIKFEAECLDSGNQQVGLLWTPESIITISLSGQLHIVDPETGKDTIIDGHTKGITALTISQDTLFTASYDGQIFGWNMKTATPTSSMRTASQVTCANTSKGNGLVAGCLNGSIFFGTTKTVLTVFGDDHIVGVCAIDDRVVAISTTSVAIVAENKVMQTMQLSLEATCICTSLDKGYIAIGGDKVLIYTFIDGLISKSPIFTIDNQSTVTALAFSHGHLAIGDERRRIRVYELTADPQNRFSAMKCNWCFHSAKVTSLAWSESGHVLVSGGLDSDVYGWELGRPNSYYFYQKNAHSGPIAGIVFAGDKKIVTAGHDATVRLWSIQ